MRPAVSIVFLALLALASPAIADNLSKREFKELKKEAQRAALGDDRHVAMAKMAQLAADDSVRAAEALAEIAVRVPDLFETSQQLVSRMASPEVLEYLSETVSATRGKAEEKIFCVEVLAMRDGAEAGRALGAALGNHKRQANVARAAIDVIRKRRRVHAVDGLIDLMEELEDGEGDALFMNQVRQALLDVTGEQFATAEDFRNFWEPRKDSFRPVTGGRRRTLQGGTSERKRPTFFGTEINSDRLVFVIDVSSSMSAADPPRAGGQPPAGGQGPRTGDDPNAGNGGRPLPPGATSRVRIERAKYQLMLAIDALPEHARFTIMAYSGGGVIAADPDHADEPIDPTLSGFEWLQIWRGKPDLHQATASNKAKARTWVGSLQANGSTFTYNALLHAFRVQEADSIVVLSDGVPAEGDRENGGQMTTHRILTKIQSKNRFRRLRIDTFGFSVGNVVAVPGGLISAPGGLGRFMQDLASQNGGNYTEIR